MPKNVAQPIMHSRPSFLTHSHSCLGLSHAREACWVLSPSWFPIVFLMSLLQNLGGILIVEPSFLLATFACVVLVHRISCMFLSKGICLRKCQPFVTSSVIGQIRKTIFSHLEIFLQSISENHLKLCSDCMIFGFCKDHFLFLDFIFEKILVESLIFSKFS